MVTIVHTFADNAPALRSAGWAVTTAAGKRPTKGNFTKWKAAPGPQTIAEWALSDPDADIVYVAGLCSGKNGRRGVIVVDADDADAVDQAQDFFGATPGKVRTRRGQHAIYDGTGIDLGTLCSLRPYGLNIDLKHGQRGAAIVVAPPSLHEKERSFRYRWEDGVDETVLRELPLFPVKLLQDFLEKRAAMKGAAAANKPETVGRTERTGFRDGSRGLELNDYLVSQAFYCDTFDELLDVARTWNADLIDHCRGPLDDKEVIDRTRSVWRDHEKRPFQPMFARGGVARLTRNERDALLHENPKIAGDAYLLLGTLRMEHSARCSRGETFAIDVNAMARDNVLNGWTRERYQRAKDLLLHVGLSICVEAHRTLKGGRNAAQFTLG
jgi:hypothetical protein